MDHQECIKKFWEINSKVPFGSATIALYFKLIHQSLQSGSLSEISITDSELVKLLKINKKTIRASRKLLKDNYLITYNCTNGKPIEYSLINEYVISSTLPLSNSSELNVTKNDSTFQNLISLSPIEKLIATKNPESKSDIKKEQLEIISESVEPKADKPEIVEKKVAERKKKTTTKKATQKKTEEIPSEEEFLNYAKTLEPYDPENPNIDFKIKTKYQQWLDNGWKNHYGIVIHNWKTAIASSLPYLITPTNPMVSSPVSIKRPKSTYNE